MRNGGLVAGLVGLAIVLAAGVAGGQAICLRCDGQENPLALDTPTPVLTWQSGGTARDTRQAAYQVIVSSTPQFLAEGNGDLWDSGRVESAAQRVTYSGRGLRMFQRAFWTVRTWAPGADAPIAGDTAEWTVGILSPEGWQAKWISGGDEGLPLFRKEVTVGEKPLKRAIAYVCGLGHFELSINGARVGDHVFDPGWTNYRATCLYVPFDVTALFKPGANAVGVMLGNGMYNVSGGRYTKFTGSFGKPTLILQLRLEFEDGVETIGTDETWQTAAGPVTFSCIYGGEDYDARRELPGWDTPGFDAAAWGPARVTEGPGGVLRAQDAPPIRVAETLRGAAYERTAPGCYRVDLGRNLSARPYLKVRGEAGRAVTIQVSELPEGPWKGHSYTYTLKGGGEEVFRPRFTYFGFQYLFIEGADRAEDVEAGAGRPELVEAGADFVTSSAGKTGWFECDNALFNEIDAMVARSVRSNLQSVLTDCPHREKLGWLEVAHLMGPSILYHHDAGLLYRKICRDTTESQLDSGLVPDIAPEYTRFEKGFFESAEWGSASVQLPWLLYRWYGDVQTLGRQYETMARFTRYLASTRNEQGLAKGGLGDWYDWSPEHGHKGYAQHTPLELTATAMLYDNARIMAETGRILCRISDSKSFAELAERVKADFLAAYYEPATHTVATDSQAALACALHFGFIPEPDRAAVLAKLVGAVESMNYRPTTGEVCFRYLIQTLAAAGRSDVVYRIINRTDAPGYGCMLRQYNLKTLSERWDRPGESLNHCMFGHVQEWFQGFVLGIQQAPGSIGFERLRIAPELVGDTGMAQGHYDSPRGRIAVMWIRNAARFELRVTVPGNTEADIVIPAGIPGALTEDGRPVTETPGVRGVEQRDGHTVITVGSGAYRFVAQ